MQESTFKYKIEENAFDVIGMTSIVIRRRYKRVVHRAKFNDFNGF